MNSSTKKAIDKYSSSELPKNDFVEIVQNEIGKSEIGFRKFFNELIETKGADE